MNLNWLRAVAVAAVCVGAAVFLAAALGGLPGIVLALAGIAAVVMAAALTRMGLAAPILDTQREAPLLGGGVPVGAVRALL